MQLNQCSGAKLDELGNPTVDNFILDDNTFYSLDVEGLEEGILETMPWEKVTMLSWKSFQKKIYFYIFDRGSSGMDFCLIEDKPLLPVFFILIKFR